MYEVQQTQAYSGWFGSLRDQRAKGLITARLFRLTLGHFGDAKSVGAGVHELRIAFGPGYRVYFTRRGERLVLLLCGGDKDSQARDIAKAQSLASELE